MTSDWKKARWASHLEPGDILIAEDDFALILLVSEDGYPDEWLWMSNGYRGSIQDATNSHCIDALLDGRAILKPDGRVMLCRMGFDGWCERALEWWRANRSPMESD